MTPAPHAAQVRTAAGVTEFYFPGWRAPGPALQLIVFGGVCFAVSVVGMLGVASAHDPDAAAFMAAILMSVFLLPVAVFGLVFVVTGVYRACHTVEMLVDEYGIRAVYRIFGLRVRRLALLHAGIDNVILSVSASRQSFLSARPNCSLVAVLGKSMQRRLLVDGIAGREAALQLLEQMTAAAGSAPWVARCRQTAEADADLGRA